MTREELWGTITDMTGRLSAIEQELRMRAPRHDKLEASMDTLNRQMDRMVVLGTQAIENLQLLKTAHDQAIGTLTRGQRRLQTDLRAHISRSLIQIFRERWPEMTPWIGTAMLLLFVNRELADRLWLWAIGALPG